MKNKALIIIISIMTLQLSAQKAVLFEGGTAHLGNGKVIKNSAISVKNGVFEFVADVSKVRINPNAFDTIYKIYGKHVYPSFIVPNTTIGLTEIGAVRATNDFNEVGGVNPHIKTLTAYNTDSKITPTIRSNGILIAQICPRGGSVSGQSSIMHLDGENWEDAVIKADDGIHINWPKSYYKTGWWAEEGETKKNKNYKQQIAEIDKLFALAKAYSKAKKIIDLKMENMLGVFNNSKNLYIHVNYVSDIKDAINFALKYKISNLIIVGGEDALKIKELFIKNKIPIILNRVHRLPSSQDSHVNEPFEQPMKLEKEGILYCLSYAGDMEAMGARNLPFTAGTTVAYGQDYESAVKSITLNTAKILGIDNIVGSIEEGKDATFFISSGDALDMRTNNVEKAYIQGVSIDLNNHQKKLFEKYKN